MHVLIIIFLIFLRPSILYGQQEIYKVPVVIHIVYSSQWQNISQEQILSQLKVLNEDYRKLNSDTVKIISEFKDLSSDCGIEFYLAGKDPLGNSTTGITRTLTSHGPFGNSDIYYSSKGGKDAWDATKYLNIWVCDVAPGIEGFASSPGGVPERDGVVIDFEQFGTEGTVKPPYQKGRTATHEIGHWLGLSHLWGNSLCADGDGIGDTPLQDGPIYNCDVKRASCGHLNMVQNFMQYGADSCLLFFTSGQREVMRKTLQEARGGILSIQQVSIHNHVVIANPVIGGELKLNSKSNLGKINIMLFTPDNKIVFKDIFYLKEKDAVVRLGKMVDGLYIVYLFTEDNFQIFKALIIN